MGQSFKVWEGGEPGAEGKSDWIVENRAMSEDSSSTGRWLVGGLRGQQAARCSGLRTVAGTAVWALCTCRVRTWAAFWVLVSLFVECLTFRVLVKIECCNRDKLAPCCVRGDL